MLTSPSAKSLRIDPVSTRTVAERSPRYPFLDGLRGLTALYVLIHHAAAELDAEKLRGLALKVALPLRFGHYAVAIFIVLSGFCLALPVVNDPEKKLRGGFWSYLGRRARRILPPYFAALALFLGLMAAFPALNTPMTERWAVALPVFSPGVIVSHLLLAHNLSPHWAGKVDPPMWSIAVEWQIYLVFPLLLILWRRFGIGPMVLVAVLLGNLDKVVSMLVGYEVYNGTCPWYLGLFALGAWAAWMTRREGEAFPWIVASAVLVAISYHLMNHYTAKVRWNDQIFGLASACCLIAFARTSGQGGIYPDLVRRVFESRLALGLGAFSYSLYLTHFPLLSWSHGWMRLQGWGPGLRLGLLLGVSSPLALGFAYAFYRLVERPTLRSASADVQSLALRRVRGFSVGSEPTVAEPSNGAVIG